MDRSIVDLSHPTAVANNYSIIRTDHDASLVCVGHTHGLTPYGFPTISASVLSCTEIQLGGSTQVCRTKSLGNRALPRVPVGEEPEIASSVIVEMRRGYLVSIISDPKKRGEVEGAIFGCLRFEEWYVSEKCLAAEDAFAIANFLKRGFHDFFRGSCLPECYYVELSWYCGCFDEAWNVAELLDCILGCVMLYVQ